MTTPLTIAQRAGVVKECADNIYFWACPEEWTPDFESDDPYDRVEALAIVQWLADLITDRYRIGNITRGEYLTLCVRLVELQAGRDIPALESLVYELKETP